MLYVFSCSILPSCDSVCFVVRAHRDIQIKGSIYYTQRQIYGITAPAVNCLIPNRIHIEIIAIVCPI